MCVVVDTDTLNDPMLFAPHNGLRVVSHRGMGYLPFDPKRVRSHLTKAQQRDQFVDGYELYEQLKRRPLLNANYLHAWMQFMDEVDSNEQLLLLFPLHLRRDPNGRTNYLFFWGTLYENAVGRRFVRYMCKTGGQKPSHGLVGLDCPHFRINSPAAVWR